MRGCHGTVKSMRSSWHVDQLTSVIGLCDHQTVTQCRVTQCIMGVYTYSFSPVITCHRKLLYDSILLKILFSISQQPAMSFYISVMDILKFIQYANSIQIMWDDDLIIIMSKNVQTLSPRHVVYYAMSIYQSTTGSWTFCWLYWYSRPSIYPALSWAVWCAAMKIELKKVYI